jgi:predicted phage tail protein
MENKTDLINSIEEKLRKLLLSYEGLKQQNESLKQQIQIQANKQLKLNSQVYDLEDQLLAAKIANSILGSNEGAKETTNKINLLIREIDKCIVALNE